MRRAAPVLLGLVVALAACGKKDGGGAPAVSASATTAPAPPAPVATSAPLVKLEPVSFAPIVKQVNASVVTITTVGEEVVEGWGGHRARREAKGLGTGFVIDKDGTILTNNHVVSEGDGNEAQSISVKLADDRVLPAKVIGRDQPTDIAVIHIDPKGLDLKPIPLGDSDALSVGDWVVAIGNPFGLEHTVSAGIVSAKGRTKDDVPLDPAGYYDFLQTDASINPGNSGGPLLNLSGQVVGINSAIRGGGAQGIGFAIPINMIKQLLPMLLRDGRIVRSAIGVSIRDAHELSDDDRSDLKIADDKGAVVEYVTPGGPADRAGLQPGDVIVAFDGKPIGRGQELQWMASTTGVGKTVTLKVDRVGKPQDVRVTLGVLQARR